MEVLRLGDQRRYNRQARLLAWLVWHLRPIVTGAVSDAIAAAFGEKVRPKPLPWKKLVRSIPGYREED